MNSIKTRLRDEEIRSLANHEAKTCLSIYLPAAQSGPDVQQGPIRLRNLISQAKENLPSQEKGLDQALDQLEELSHDELFWRHQYGGLALFLSDDLTVGYKLQRPVDETLWVGEQFLVRPLVWSLHSAQCLMLAVTWKGAKMYRVTLDGISEVHNELFPLTADDLVTERDPEKQLQYTSHRQGNSAVASTGEAMFHGHGEGEGKRDADRVHYLKRVGERASVVARNEAQPLAILATEEVQGELSSATSLEAAASYHASADGLDESQMEEAAQSLRKEIESGVARELAERFEKAAGAKRTTSEMEATAVAAMTGKVDVLLISEDRPIWGTLDAHGQKVEKHDTRTDGDTDLVNETVRATLKNGGSVRPFQHETINELAAILRYS